MPAYFSPGVYVEETSFRQSTIAGVSTSIAGIVGPTRFGQVRGRPLLVTSIADFEANFGTIDDLNLGGADHPNYTALSVRAFFDNGGQQLYVARVTRDIAGTGDQTLHAQTATAAPVTPPITPPFSLPSLPGPGATPPLHLQARAPGSGGNFDVVFAPRRSPSRLTTSVSSSDTDVVVLRLSNVTDAQLVNAAAGLATPLRRVVAIGHHNPGPPEHYDLGTGRRVYFLDANGTAHAGDVATLAAGITADPAIRQAARRVALLPTTDSTGAPGPYGAAPLYSIAAGPILAQLLNATGALPAVFYATAGADGGTLNFPRSVNPTLPADEQLPIQLAVADLWPSQDAGGSVFVDNYDLLVQRNGLTIYSVNNAALAPDAPNSLAAALPMNPTSGTAQAAQPVGIFYATPAPAAADVWAALNASFSPTRRNPADPAATPALAITLAGGTDGSPPTINDYVGMMDDQNGSYGLAAFEDIDQISMVLCPAAAADAGIHTGVIVEMLRHCRKMAYRMAIIEGEQGMSIAGIQGFRAQFSDSLLALYYPWVKATAADGTSEVILPPSGFMAGLYADTDVRRGVYKAPANEVIQGTTGLELYVNTFQQDVLNPLSINCLRFFPNRGYRVWGGRTLSDDPEWLYVNVRRYFLFLEHSIHDATSSVVFEPNGERLWANVRATVSDFLFNEWANGHLLGSKSEQAFFVRCDRTTMTQHDLDNGILVCVIGVAPLRPAEFVVFRIGQKTADA
jgi:hypothetical protein